MPEGMEISMQEAYDIARNFKAIGDILKNRVLAEALEGMPVEPGVFITPKHRWHNFQGAIYAPGSTTDGKSAVSSFTPIPPNDGILTSL